MHISSPKFGSIVLAPINPANIQGLLLQGSKTMFAEKEYGSMLIQEYATEHYSIRYSIFNFSKRISLLFKNENAGLRSMLSLENDSKIKIVNNKQIPLLEGEYILMKGQNTIEKISFEKSGQYKFFDTFFSLSLIQQLGKSFPALQNLLEGRLDSKDKTEIKAHRNAPHQLLAHSYDILKCPYEDGFRRFYFENKIRDYLFDLLVHSATEVPANQLADTEIEALKKARQIILADITKHFTIQSLSRQVQLNEFKLKTGFKQQYNTGIFECLLEARMQSAKELLRDTNKPIKEIAALIGYTHLTSFITAFRKHFGYTPGSIRRK